RMHPALGHQPLGDARVSLRPGAPRPAGSEALAIGGLVPAADLAVDPAVAERLLERLVVGEAGRLRRALLGQHEPDPGRVVMFAQPSPPRVGIANDQLRQLDGHDRTACQDRNSKCVFSPYIRLWNLGAAWADETADWLSAAAR